MTVFSIHSNAFEAFISEKEPIVIDAEKYEYFDDFQKIRATGNVETTQDSQKIHANFIEYDIQKDLLLAKDKVKIIQQQGYIIEADRVILSDRLTLGSINNFTVFLPDKSTLKGSFAKKSNNYISNIENGSFTSCKICPGKKTIWSINAKHAELNEKDNSIVYKHAVMKFYDLPVFYTPYFAHYVSRRKRESGFLTPTYRGSSSIGSAIAVPYYLNLAPNYDATITTILSKKRDPLIEGQFRYLSGRGQINNQISIIKANKYLPPKGQTALKHNMRYNLETETNLAISNHKNLGWNAKVTSDKSFRHDYGYGDEDYLTSKVYLNNQESNGYYQLQSMYFQSLRPNNGSQVFPMNQTPIVIPLFESDHQVYQFQDDSSLNFETSFLKILRYNGVNSTRVSFKNIWNKDLLLESGNKFNLFGSLRSDIYHYSDNQQNSSVYTGNVTRIIPEAGINWSYPMIKNFKKSNIIVMPIASVIFTPHSNYNKNIYSEDSVGNNEINDGNLFSESKYNGIDLVENTSRASYGIKAISNYDEFLKTSVLFGQMYQQKPQNDFTDGNTAGKFSDYVSRIQFEIIEHAVFSYQFKLDKQTLLNKTNELSLLLKYKKLYILGDVLYYNDNQKVNGVINRREIYLETGINDYKDISLSINARKNLSSKADNPDLFTDPNGFISFGSKIKYINDCIEYSFGINKDFTKNNDKKKEDTQFWWNIKLKNFG